MSTTGLKSFDSTVQLTNAWLNELAEEMGWRDHSRAYHALRAVLQALRDRLTVEEVAALGAKLPMLVRGFYYEGWHPAGTPTRERHLAGFIDHVAAQLPRGTTINPGEAARACLAVMERCLDRGELVKLRGSLPHEVLNLFPDSLVRQ